MFDVCLVSMPFAAVERPSIALGLLQAILAEAGISATSLYANISFAEEVGPAEYGFWESTLGDMAFSGAAFPDFHPDLTRHLRLVFRRRRAEARQAGLPDEEDDFLECAHDLRRRAAEFVRRTARAALDTAARVVGCTSMYWQHAASLALLREVRRLDPSVVTMLGGANCEGVMGLATHRNFTWVDYVVSGEADDLIAGLCRTALSGSRAAPPADLPFGVFGPAHRQVGYPPRGGHDGAPRAACRDLGRLPPPDYDDYFRTLRASPLAGVVRPGLLVETARGCWWGAIRQCKFCGISETGMVYHSKPPERVVAEFRQLESRYAVSDFEVTDNILDMSYFKTVIPRLAECADGRRIFWETKANLKRTQLAQLAEAGVTWIQPGIESLDSRVLSIMDKGVSASQNVQLLKWCREFGVRLSWNLLWGFPGEEDAWYAEMAAPLPLLEHLQPPRLALRLRYDRYSVYEARAAEYGLKLVPLPFMFLTYPVSPREMADLTYYFGEEGGEGSKREPLGQRPGVGALCEAVRSWQRNFWRRLRPVLSLEDDGGQLRILDTRRCAVEARTALRGLARAVYLACDDAPTRAKLVAVIEKDYGLTPAHDEVERVLADLRRRRLILDLDERFISLAVRGPLPQLPRDTQFPGGYTLPLRPTDGRVGKSQRPARPDATPTASSVMKWSTVRTT